MNLTQNERQIQWNRGLWTAALLLLLLAILSCVGLGMALGRRASVERQNTLELVAVAGPSVSVTEPDGTVSRALPAPNRSGAEAEEYSPIADDAFWAGDKDGEWGLSREINLFPSSYINADGEITVESGDGTAVVAPGTSGAYDFSLKNTGEAPVKYELHLETIFEVDGAYVPVRVRLRSGDEWLIGTDSEWVTPKELTAYDEEDTLAVNNYRNYTFEWEWPFEDADPTQLRQTDALDTDLGNRAAGIRTTLNAGAETDDASANPSGDAADNPSANPSDNASGQGAAQYSAEDANFILRINTFAEYLWDDGSTRTGDTGQMTLWIVTLTVSAAGGAGLILWLVWKRRKDESEDEIR